MTRIIATFETATLVCCSFNITQQSDNSGFREVNICEFRKYAIY